MRTNSNQETTKNSHFGSSQGGNLRRDILIIPFLHKNQGKQKGNKLQSPKKGSRGEHSTCKERSSRHKAAIVPTPCPRQWQHVVGLLRRRACAPAAGGSLTRFERNRKSKPATNLLMVVGNLKVAHLSYSCGGNM